MKTERLVSDRNVARISRRLRCEASRSQRYAFVHSATLTHSDWPRVATLSLGSHTILDLYEYADPPTHDKAQSRAIRPEPSFSILLPPRSLFVLTEDLYADCLHGIAARETDTAEQLGRCVNWTMRDALAGDGPDVTEAAGWDRARRVSLTLRTVERVRKLL